MSQILKRIEVAVPISLGIFSYGILLGGLMLFSSAELLPLSFAGFLGRFLSVPAVGLVFAFIESSLIFLLCLLPGAVLCVGALGYIKPTQWVFNASIAAFVMLSMHAYFVSIPRLSSHPDMLSVSLFAMEALLSFACYLAAANIGSAIKKRLTRHWRRTR